MSICLVVKSKTYFRLEILLVTFHDYIPKSNGKLSFPGRISIMRTDPSIFVIFAGTIISELKTTVTRPWGSIDFILAVNFIGFFIFIFVLALLFLIIID